MLFNVEALRFWLVLSFFSLLTLLCSSAHAHSAPKTLLVLGDSLSAEYGLGRGTGWVALLEQKMQSQATPTKIINASISGETSSGGKARLQTLLTQYQPQIVIIELGGNDALRGLDLKASEKNFREMIQMIKQAKAKPLLVGMRIPPNYGKTYAYQFFAMYAQIAKDTGCALVPFFLEGVADQAELFQADRIHLTAQAHPRMMENVWKPLQKMLKK